MWPSHSQALLAKSMLSSSHLEPNLGTQEGNHNKRSLSLEEREVTERALGAEKDREAKTKTILFPIIWKNVTHERI